MRAVRRHRNAFRRLARRRCCRRWRGGSAFRSITSMVSASPLPSPLLADHGDIARRTDGETVRPHAAGDELLRICDLVAVNRKDEMRLSPSRVTSARLPSGVKATCSGRISASPSCDLGFGREHLASDRQHRDRAFAAVGDQHQLAVRAERQSRGSRAERRWRLIPICGGELRSSTREPVVVCGLLRIGRSMPVEAADQRDRFVGRDGDALRRGDHARRNIEPAR